MNKFFVFKGSFSENLEDDYVQSWGIMFYTKEAGPIKNYLKATTVSINESGYIVGYRDSYELYEDEIHVVGHNLTSDLKDAIHMLGYEIVEVPWEHDTTDTQMRKWVRDNYPDEGMPEKRDDNYE